MNIVLKILLTILLIGFWVLVLSKYITESDGMKEILRLQIQKIKHNDPDEIVPVVSVLIICTVIVIIMWYMQ